MRSKILAIVLVIAAVVVIGVGVGLLASRGPAHTPPEPAQVADNSAPQTPSTPTHVTARPQNPQPVVQPIVTPQPTPMVQPTNIAAATNTSGSETNWEEKI